MLLRCSCCLDARRVPLSTSRSGQRLHCSWQRTFLFRAQFLSLFASNSRALVHTCKISADARPPLQVLTGNDWVMLMRDSVHAVGPWAMLYYLSLVVVGNFIAINLCVAILLSALQQQVQEQAALSSDGAYRSDTLPGEVPSANSQGENTKAPLPKASSTGECDTIKAPLPTGAVISGGGETAGSLLIPVAETSMSDDADSLLPHDAEHPLQEPPAPGPTLGHTQVLGFQRLTALSESSDQSSTSSGHADDCVAPAGNSRRSWQALASAAHLDAAATAAFPMLNGSSAGSSVVEGSSVASACTQGDQSTAEQLLLCESLGLANRRHAALPCGDMHGDARTLQGALPSAVDLCLQTSATDPQESLSLDTLLLLPPPRGFHAVAATVATYTENPMFASRRTSGARATTSSVATSRARADFVPNPDRSNGSEGLPLRRTGIGQSAANQESSEGRAGTLGDGSARGAEGSRSTTASALSAGAVDDAALLCASLEGSIPSATETCPTGPVNVWAAGAVGESTSHRMGPSPQELRTGSLGPAEREDAGATQVRAPPAGFTRQRSVRRRALLLEGDQGTAHTVLVGNGSLQGVFNRDQTDQTANSIEGGPSFMLPDATDVPPTPSWQDNPVLRQRNRCDISSSGFDLPQGDQAQGHRQRC